MKSSDKIWRLVPITFFGSWFTYKLNQTSESDFMFDAIIFLIIGSIGLAVFVWIFYHDNKEFKKTKSILSFIPTLTGLLFICIILIIYLILNKRDNSPTLIKAYYDGDYNGFSIDLKKNGNYIMANGSFGGNSYFYGTYSIKDSIITLDKSHIDNVIKTEKLVIRSVKSIYQQYTIEGEDTTNVNYIFQKDRNGIELIDESNFKIIEDNRKK